MNFHILTIFPRIFDSYLNESILKRAIEKNIINVKALSIRDFTEDKHNIVDDTPYGGGAGMVLKIEPIARAINSILNSKKQITNPKQISVPKLRNKKTRIILFSTRGKKFDSRMAKRLSKYDQVIMICGRYEGVDERVAGYIADEEISIGDYVLSGGELPALVVTEAVARFIPGVLGKYESLEEIKGSYPVYTKPENFAINKNGKKKNLSVPKVLLSGNHKEIEEWRKKMSA
jgi:tRNA (guanine37-N1)-methyltransferase